MAVTVLLGSATMVLHCPKHRLRGHCWFARAAAKVWLVHPRACALCSAAVNLMQSVVRLAAVAGDCDCHQARGRIRAQLSQRCPALPLFGDHPRAALDIWLGLQSGARQAITEFSLRVRAMSCGESSSTAVECHCKARPNRLWSRCVRHAHGTSASLWLPRATPPRDSYAAWRCWGCLVVVGIVQVFDGHMASPAVGACGGLPGAEREVEAALEEQVGSSPPPGRAGAASGSTCGCGVGCGHHSVLIARI